MKWTKEQIIFCDKFFEYALKTRKAFKILDVLKEYTPLFNKTNNDKLVDVLLYFTDKGFIENNENFMLVTPTGREFAREYNGSVKKYLRKQNQKIVINKFKNVGIVFGALITIYTFVKLVYNDNFNQPPKAPVENVIPVAKPNVEKIQTSTDSIPSTQIKVNLQTSKPK